VIQDRTYHLRNIALDAVIQLTRDIRSQVQKDSVAAASRIAAARGYQRRAQFYADFIEAENSMGFHADQEAALETKNVRQPPQLVSPPGTTPSDSGKPK
jgi:nitrite reductase (cytochrome c-552)